MYGQALTTTCCSPQSSSNRVIIDLNVFGQILELGKGDEDDKEFAREMVDDYLEQAQAKLKEMNESFAKHELTQLGQYGHFLKGSSAALGVVRVQEICEKIQHLGNRIDPDKESEVKISTEDAFARIKPLLVRLKEEHPEAARSLKKLLEGNEP
ncbi:histidine-phosphotransfer domain, HPT domain-containing protein [Imleria badia]|nr:histidine-phosphotransfer domain, HPT domain-containing protein [Imleria badia]